MFRKTVALTLLGLFLLAAIWAALFARPTQKDYAHQKALLEKKQQTSTKAFASETHQNRKNVVKEIYFTQQDNSRLEYRIESESSILTVIPDGNKLILNEKLEKIKCWMQDKIYYSPSGKDPMQQIRFLEAKEGVYLYNSQQFLAQSVILSLYRLKTHELPTRLTAQSPFLKGIAGDISFVVSGKTPQFQAHDFKALLNQDTQ